MHIDEYAKARYTTKAFDPARRIPQDQVTQIETLLRFSPSSTNVQPWHFFIAGTDEGKERIAKATTGFYSFNAPKVLNASHVVVFCTRNNVDEAHLQAVLAQEDKDGRFHDAATRDGWHGGRSYFVNMHRFELRDVQHWMEKQVYLALGTLLYSVSLLGIDACPMEGFDQRILDQELDLRTIGCTSSVIVPLGYRAADDFNAKLPKSRLPGEAILTRL